MFNSYRVELRIRFLERKGECGSYFSIITQSFKFDGKIKPLLNGKKKQFGLFALVTPVNPANPFTSTPKELLQLYSCKMGLDLRVRKLDTRCVSYLNPWGRNCSKVPYSSPSLSLPPPPPPQFLFTLTLFPFFTCLSFRLPKIW